MISILPQETLTLTALLITTLSLVRITTNVLPALRARVKRSILQIVSGQPIHLTYYIVLTIPSLVLVALRAGCTQRPPPGMLVGLDGTIFSQTPVNITYPGDNHDKKRSGLSKGGIIGISVSAAVFLLMLSAALFVCYRKYRDGNRMTKLKSPLDSRFGAQNITSPNSGAYGNPYAAPAVKLSPPFDVSSLSVKERQLLGLQQPVGSRHISSPSYPPPKAWEGTTQQPNNNLPPYSPPGMPFHQAYIPNVPATVPESPVTSIASSGTYQNSPHHSPNPSPTYVPSSVPSATSHQGSASLPNHVSPRITPQPSPSQVDSIQTRLEPRSHSRASARRVITKFTGMGSSNTTTGFSSPVQISAPIVGHGPRFDYELREQDERDPYGRRRRPETPNRIETPQSAESEEQWPGSY